MYVLTDAGALPSIAHVISGITNADITSDCTGILWTFIFWFHYENNNSTTIIHLLDTASSTERLSRRFFTLLTLVYFYI